MKIFGIDITEHRNEYKMLYSRKKWIKPSDIKRLKKDKTFQKLNDEQKEVIYFFIESVSKHFTRNYKLQMMALFQKYGDIYDE